MKKHLYISICLLLALQTACRKSDLQSYGSPDMVYVFKARFGSSTNDSVTYSFATKQEGLQFDTVWVPVRIMGTAAAHDRVVNYDIVKEKSTIPTDNYTLLPALIKANSYTGFLPVKLMKSAVLKEQEMRLWIKIGTSADFKGGVDDQLTYLIKVNDFLSKPTSWKETLFGKYSNVKYDLIIKASGQSEFNNLGNTGEKFILQLARNALYAYENEHGMLYDELGEIVSFP